MLTSPKDKNGLECNTPAEAVLLPACEACDRLHAQLIISKECRRGKLRWQETGKWINEWLVKDPVSTLIVPSLVVSKV